MRMLRVFSLVTVLISLLVSTQGLGQSVEINSIQFYQNKAILTYSILDPKGRTYSIVLYSSKDNFEKKLVYVSGDIGNEVLAGKQKKIVWDIKKELGDFTGDLSFQLSCSVVEDFVVTKTFKRGRQYQIRWNAVSSLGETIKIELINSAQEKVWVDGSVPNTGHYNWKIPSTIKSGDDYKLQFTNVDNAIESNVSNYFQIRPKTPLIVKAAGVAIIGGVVFILKGSKGSGGSEPLPAFSSIGFPNK